MDNQWGSARKATWAFGPMRNGDCWKKCASIPDCVMGANYQSNNGYTCFLWNNFAELAYKDKWLATSRITTDPYLKQTSSQYYYEYSCGPNEYWIDNSASCCSLFTFDKGKDPFVNPVMDKAGMSFVVNTDQGSQNNVQG